VEAEVQKCSNGYVIDTAKLAEVDLMYRDLYSDVVVSNIQDDLMHEDLYGDLVVTNKHVEEYYGHMPEEIETAILELQGIEETEEIGEVQDELTEKGTSTNEDQCLIAEGEPEEKCMYLLLWLKSKHSGYVQLPSMGEFLDYQRGIDKSLMLQQFCPQDGQVWPLSTIMNCCVKRKKKKKKMKKAKLS